MQTTKGLFQGQAVKPENSLDEWYAKSPRNHLVTQELAVRIWCLNIAQ